MFPEAFMSSHDLPQVEVMSRSKAQPGGDRASKADTAFKLFDKNRDGFITREEFSQVREGIGA